VLENLQNEVLVYIILFVAFTVLGVLANRKEGVTWSPELKNSAVVNFGFIALNSIMGVFALYAVMGVNVVYTKFGLPVISEGFWADWPLAVKGIAFLLVYDFNLYWIHRWLHVISWTWPAHAVHHSDTEMHFLTWSRSHFVELILLFGMLALMGSWLGLSEAEIGLFAIVRALHQHYVHAHLNWNHGFLSKVIVSPNYHRWHHANVPAAYDKNFASIFPFYDIMFGTYYNPSSAKNVPTGFDNNPGDEFIPLLLHPFKEWQRMLSEKFGRFKTGETQKNS